MLRLIFRSRPLFDLANTALAAGTVLFTLHGEPVRAETRLPDAVIAAKRLTIGISCGYPPAAYIGLDGNPAGYEVAFVKRIGEFAARDKVVTETQCVNDANRVPFLQSGKVDLIVAALAWTPARAEQIDFSDPIWISNLQLVVPKNSTIQNYSDLTGKKVVTTTGSLYQPWLQKCYPQAELLTVQSASDASTMLVQGRADALAYIDVYGFNFAKNTPGYKIVGNLASPAVQGIGVKKGNAAMLAWINDVVGQMRAKDEFYSIFAAEIKDPEFSAKYKKIVPGPDNAPTYGVGDYLDCKG